MLFPLPEIDALATMIYGKDSSQQRIDRPRPGVSKNRATQYAFSLPLQYSRFKAFQRLGFHVWDWERMAGLGLIEVQRADKDLAPVRNGWSEFDFYFRCNSLVIEKWKNDPGEYDDPPSI